MQTLTLVSFVLVAVALMTTPPAVEAYCCLPRLHGWCGDCTQAVCRILHTCYFCSYGGCNIFGCNCDGGCRHGDCELKYLAKALVADGPELVVSAGDLNGDGLLTVEEAETMLRNGPYSAYTNNSSVQLYDKNDDGLLSLDEIDG